MKIIRREGKTREENLQRIIVEKNDKPGIAMLNYFKNSLNGYNVEKLTVTNTTDVSLWYNRLTGCYILQILKFNIAKESILENYNNFRSNYEVLIKDSITERR